MLDSLSSRNYITEKVARNLGLKSGCYDKLHIAVFGAKKPTRVKADLVEFDVTLRDSSLRRIVAISTPVICNSDFLPSHWSHEHRQVLEDLEPGLADNPFDCDRRMDVLIGAAMMWKFVLGATIPTKVPGLSLLPSSFGLMLEGTTTCSTKSQPTMLCLTESTCAYDSETGLVAQESRYGCAYPDVDEFWQLEKIGIFDDPTVTDDDRALEMTKKTIQHDGSRYEVWWPWIEERKPLLPSNYNVVWWGHWAG